MHSHDRMRHAIDSAMVPYAWVYLTTIVILVCITSKVSASGLYRCLDPLGVEIFTDSPAQLAACTAVHVGTAQPEAKIVPPFDSEKQAAKEGSRTDAADEVHSGIAIPPDSDALSMPSVSSDTPPSAPASSPDGGAP
jgi:hypothetical protein